MTGTVKWFNEVKGFGFITPDNFITPDSGGEVGDSGGAAGDVFVHHSDIIMPGYRRLDDGQRVCFGLCDHGKGLKAVNVLTIDNVRAEEATT